jgi:hypothetical protein
LDADFQKGIFHFIQLKGFDDRFNQFHVHSSLSEYPQHRADSRG